MFNGRIYLGSPSCTTHNRWAWDRLAAPGDADPPTTVELDRCPACGSEPPTAACKRIEWRQGHPTEAARPGVVVIRPEA